MNRLANKHALITGAAHVAAIVRDTPMKRFGQPEKAAYMTVAELSIDGGVLAGSTASPE